MYIYKGLEEPLDVEAKRTLLTSLHGL